jgi:hypothetical protein
MPYRTLDAEDEIEAAAMEQARAMVRERKRLADATAGWSRGRARRRSAGA